MRGWSRRDAADDNKEEEEEKGEMEEEAEAILEFPGGLMI